MKFNTKKIVYTGLFVSISIILTRLLSFYPLPTIRISFGDIPIMLAGILFGPITGAITGALSDIIGTFMFPPPTGATYFPGFTLSKILVGAIPGTLFIFLKASDLIKVTISVLVTEIICSLTLDTIWLSILYNKGMLILLPTRIISRATIMIAEVVVIYGVYERLSRMNTINILRR